MTKEDLDAIEARANASRGPWKVLPSEMPAPEFRPLFKVVGSGSDHSYTVADGMLRGNAEFVAAARSDVPALVAEVRRLHGEMEKAVKMLNGEPVELPLHIEPGSHWIGKGRIP